MLFKISGQRFNTQSMLTLDLDGHYLRLFLHPESQSLFLQTFDLDHGITIRAIGIVAAREMIKATKTPLAPDDLAFTSALDLVGPRRIVTAAPAILDLPNLRTLKNPAEIQATCSSLVTSSPARHLA